MSRLSSATQQFTALSGEHQVKVGKTTAGFLFMLMDAVLLANLIRQMWHNIPISWPLVVLILGLGTLGVALISGEGLGGISKVLTAWADAEGGFLGKVVKKIPIPFKKEIK